MAVHVLEICVQRPLIVPALDALVRRHNQGALHAYLEYVNSHHADEWPES